VFCCCLPSFADQLSQKNLSVSNDALSDPIHLIILDRKKSIDTIINTADQQIAILKKLQNSDDLIEFNPNVNGKNITEMQEWQNARTHLLRCIAAMGYMRAVEAVPWLVKYARLQGNGDLHMFREMYPCLTALSDIGTPALKPILVALFDEKSPDYGHIRVLAARFVFLAVLGRNASAVYVQEYTKNIASEKDKKQRDRFVNMLKNADEREEHYMELF